jgi:hypothetical protein
MKIDHDQTTDKVFPRPPPVAARRPAATVSTIAAARSPTAIMYRDLY